MAEKKVQVAEPRLQDHRRILHWLRCPLRVLSGRALSPRPPPRSTVYCQYNSAGRVDFARARLCFSDGSVSPAEAEQRRQEWRALRGRVVNEAICVGKQSPNDGQIWVKERRCNFELFMPAQKPSSLSAANHRPRRPPPFWMGGRGQRDRAHLSAIHALPAAPASADQADRCVDPCPMRSGPDQGPAVAWSRCGHRSRCSAAPSNCDPSFTCSSAARCRRLSRLLGRECFK
jgi:hypothetical protein